MHLWSRSIMEQCRAGTAIMTTDYSLPDTEPVKEMDVPRSFIPSALVESEDIMFVLIVVRI